MYGLHMLRVCWGGGGGGGRLPMNKFVQVHVDPHVVGVTCVLWLTNDIMDSKHIDTPSV